MILKQIFEEYDFQIESMILKEYKKLKLTLPEAMVLIALFAMYKKKRNFSIAAISRRVEYNQNEIRQIVESLIKKQFLQIDMEVKDEKEREVINLDQTFNKLEAIIIDEQKQKNVLKRENDIIKTISLFEEGLGRLLKNYELENIRSWYEDNLYTHENILKAIEQAENRVSIKYVERILTQEKLDLKVDKETDMKLERLFKSL